jgi:hypothetical protein
VKKIITAKKFVLVLVALVCTTSLVVGIHQLTFTSGGSSTAGYYKEIAIGCQLPEVPTDVPRLEVVYRDVRPDEITQIANEVFNLSGVVGELPHHDVLENGGDTGLYVENTGVGGVMLYRSGAMEYGTGESWSQAIDYVPNLPSYEKAREIAEDFMQKIENYGLVPENIDAQFSEVFPAEGVAVGGTEIVRYLGVNFKLTYNGLEIDGAKAFVKIAENGRITEFKATWKRIGEEKGRTTVTVTPEQAVEKLKSGTSLAGLPFAEKAVVKDAKLVYFSKIDPNELEDHLQVAYRFTIAPINENGVEGSQYLDWVSATDNPLVI